MVGHLIQRRPKQAIIALIDEHHLERALLRKSWGGGQSAKPGTYDDD